MDAQKVYILTGYTTLYRDALTPISSHWVVATYTSREQAEAHASRLKALVKGSSRWTRKWSQFQTDLDPTLCIEDGLWRALQVEHEVGDKADVTYEVTEAVLVRHVDEFLETGPA